jgi:hypothetical protein
MAIMGWLSSDPEMPKELLAVFSFLLGALWIITIQSKTYEEEEDDEITQHLIEQKRK